MCRTCLWDLPLVTAKAVLWLLAHHEQSVVCPLTRRPGISSCWLSQQLQTRHCPLCSYVSPAVTQSLWNDVHWKLINFCCTLPTWKTKSIQQYQVAKKKRKFKLKDDSFCLIHYLSSVYVSIPPGIPEELPWGLQNAFTGSCVLKGLQRT